MVWGKHTEKNWNKLMLMPAYECDVTVRSDMQLPQENDWNKTVILFPTLHTTHSMPFCPTTLEIVA